MVMVLTTGRKPKIETSYFLIRSSGVLSSPRQITASTKERAHKAKRLVAFSGNNGLGRIIQLYYTAFAHGPF